MTLTSSTVRLSYNGDGSTTSFSVTFVFWEKDDLRVILRDADGAETVWTRGTEYTVTGGDGSTGTVEVETSPTDFTPASGETLVILSNVPNTQLTSFPLGGPFPSTAAEQELDKTNRRVQQQEEELGRSLKFSETSPDSGVAFPDVTGNASKVPRVKSDASGLEMVGVETFDGLTVPVETGDLAGFYDTRSDITTATIASGTNFIRTAGYAAVGDGGGALYKRVGAEPSHEWKVQSADGAWWELVPDPMGVNVKQLGAKGDNSTDDHTAFDNAINNGPDLNASGVNEAHHTVIVPGSASAYYIGSTLQPKKVVHILGPGSGLDNTPKPAKLRWDANVTGIIIHTFNTTGATTEGTGTGSSGGSIIEGLHLDSDGGAIAAVTDDTKGHGVWMRGRAMVRNCRITGFPGNGINIVAASGGSGGITEGIANGWRIDGARISDCHKNGVYVDGADTNAGFGQGIDVNGCGRAAIWDQSFLGNTWIAPEAAACGTATAGENGAAESSYVDFGGTRYIANRTATEAELVATQPGTDKTVWIPVGAGSANITWQASQPEGTYFVGGSYICSAGNSVILGAYYEDGQAFPQVAGMIISGQHKKNYDAGGISMRFNEWSGAFTWPNLETFPEATLDKELTMGFWQDNQRPFRVVADGDNPLGLSIPTWDNAGGRWALRHGGDAWMYITSDLTTATYGRASAFDPGYPVFERGFVLGNFSGARHMNNATAAPSSGEHARGEIYWNQDQAQSGVVGWVCTAAGTPGTWAEIRGAGTQQSHIADPSGGSTVDAEARTAINSILAVIEHFGFTATS